YPSVDTLDFHSFPTRRSSDLNQAVFGSHKEETALFKLIDRYHCCDLFFRLKLKQIYDSCASGCSAGLRNLISFYPVHPSCTGKRSEEHTSELQSRFDLVCRLL